MKSQVSLETLGLVLLGLSLYAISIGVASGLYSKAKAFFLQRQAYAEAMYVGEHVSYLCWLYSGSSLKLNTTAEVWGEGEGVAARIEGAKAFYPTKCQVFGKAGPGEIVLRRTMLGVQLG